MTDRTPASLTALGGRPLPARIEAAGRSYGLVKVFKNDFFAVTALYDGDGDRVVLKVHRRARFMLVPFEWVGRWLVRHEWNALQRLRDVSGVPEPVARWGTTGLVRRYIEGHPLQRGEHVPDDFHERLRTLIETMHARGMAYVDLEKCENVIVGDDGRPYAIDFQISWHLPAAWGGELWPMRKLRGWLQAGDRYHLRKLQRRTRPDQLTEDELAATYRRPWYVRAHRIMTWPLTWCRRRILDRVDPRRGRGERGRVVED